MPETQERTASSIVTGETRQEFMQEKLAKPDIRTSNTPVKSKAEREAAAAKVAEKPIEVKPNGAEPADKKGGSIDERLSEMSAKRREAEKRAEDAIRRAEELTRELEVTKRPKDAKPVAEHFSDPVKYAEALADWMTNDRLRKQQDKDQKDAEEKRQSRLTAEWNQRYKKCQKEIEDFDDVIMAEPLSLQPWVQQAMFESEVGPQLHYFFSKDRDEASKINAMPAAAALKYMGRIEARIEADNEARGKKANVENPPLPIPKPLPIRRAQEAPEPIKPIEGSQQVGPGGVVDVDGNVTGSYADYRNARRAGKIK